MYKLRDAHLNITLVLFLYAEKIQKLNETQWKFDLDYLDYVNVGGYEQREQIANLLPNLSR